MKTTSKEGDGKLLNPTSDKPAGLWSSNKRIWFQNCEKKGRSNVVDFLLVSTGWFWLGNSNFSTATADIEGLRAMARVLNSFGSNQVRYPSGSR